MRKQIAFVIDTSGSMYHPAANDCVHDKVVEASESAQWILDEIKNHVRSSGDEWAVSIWRFASTFQGLVGQTMFDPTIQDFTVDVMKNVVAAIEDQSSNQSSVGNMTDIFGAVRQASDWMENLPVAWPSFPSNGAPDKRTIYLFTDGSQTIQHNGSTSRSGYEAAEGVTFQNLLNGRGITLNAQGIGSDLLLSTLTDLAAQAAPGSSTKVIADTGGYSADCSAALMTNALKAVNDNGVLELRPASGTPSGLLWEQFSLPVRHPDPPQGSDDVRDRLVNHADFEVDVDGVSRELVLGLTWHQPGKPSIEATSPSGNVFKDGVGSAFIIQQGWMQALHVPSPEAGTWQARVSGDKKLAPVRMNFMARGINPKFKLWASAEPWTLAKPGRATIVARPRLDDKAATGTLKATATILGGPTTTLKRQRDGSYRGPVTIKQKGVTLIRVEVRGKLKSKASVHRFEYVTVQLGRPMDPRLRVRPDSYEQGGRYDVHIELDDAQFNGASSVKFGAGIKVDDFRVLSGSVASAKIRVSGDAAPGPREVVSLNPAAETYSGVTVVEREGKSKGVSGRIRCLQFDRIGQLTAISLHNGTEVAVTVFDPRLQAVLENARDENRVVHVHVAGDGSLRAVDVC